MVEFLPFIVSGTVVGAVYGLAATGLVLTYKISGIFNFGHGALATVAAYVFYWLHAGRGLDWRVTLIFSVLVVGPALGLVMGRVAASLGPRPAGALISKAIRASRRKSKSGPSTGLGKVGACR